MEVSERIRLQSELLSPKSDFTWSKNWYPVAVASLLEEDKPNKVTLLGRDYVVWYADGMWNAAKDECPHRWDAWSLPVLTQTRISCSLVPSTISSSTFGLKLHQAALLRSMSVERAYYACRFAALSVGRVEDGQLFCRYHGWGFKGGEEGRCSCNPQAVGPEAEATVLNSSRSRLQTYPSQVIDCPLSDKMRCSRCMHTRHFHTGQTQTYWHIHLSYRVPFAMIASHRVSGPHVHVSLAKALKRDLCAQVEQGLLWIWPESGADAWLEASAKPPVTTPEMANPAFAGAQADFAFMENPASLQVMLVGPLPERYSMI